MGATQEASPKMQHAKKQSDEAASAVALGHQAAEELLKAAHNLGAPEPIAQCDQILEEMRNAMGHATEARRLVIEANGKLDQLNQSGWL